MKAPDHYAEALRRLKGTRVSGGGDRPTTYSPTPEDIAIAQVHATLALAVATGDMLTDFSEHLADHHKDDP